MSTLPKHVEDIHPSLWRGHQLARGVGRVVPTGHDNLSVELPGGGWPIGALVELLSQQPGIGEVRLLQPALSAVAERPIALVKPPLIPDTIGLSYVGLPVKKLLRLEPQTTSDALWTTEQILKANSCGAVLVWQEHMRADSLRRLSLHALTADVLFFLLRPLSTQRDASPATLCLVLRPADEGINIEIVKRKGPIEIEPFDVRLKVSPVLLSKRGRSTQPAQKIEVAPSLLETT
jgi:protein ImuA